MNKKGYTMSELLVVMAIAALLSVIGIQMVLSFRTPSLAKAQGNSEALRQFLNYSQIASLGAVSNIVVVVRAADNFYYGCVDSNADDDCATGEQAALRLPMPDTLNIGGANFKGVKLNYDVKLGLDTGGVPKRFSGSVTRTADGTYYLEGTGGAIGSGVFLSGASSNKLIFKRDGSVSAGAAANSSGEVYLYLRKDANNKFYYALNVSPRGKVNLFYWTDVGGQNRWKMRQ